MTGKTKWGTAERNSRGFSGVMSTGPAAWVFSGQVDRRV